MICSSCGSPNAPGRRFCGECAAPLARACPACGSPNEPTAKFCGQCAAPLAAGEQAAATRPAPSTPAEAPFGGAVAERRVVSVLFADLVGFTPFAEERDAEDVRETLTRYLDLATDVIARYGGTVEKFIGDAVMAVWGAPTAQEDDAERAVRAGLDLVESVRTLGPGIQARGGVMTGEAAVTLGATNQGMVAGDLVNTAARLQAVAPPGTVLVGQATHRAASQAIAFEEAGDHLLKGKRAPVAAWRALRVVAQRRGHGRSDMPEPPFVGRDEEFRLLRDLVMTASRDRRARLVSVTGPAGIGKSRLAWELEKYIDGVTEAIYWHHGRSPAYGDGITFWALGEMVRRRAGLAELDDEATTRRQVAAVTSEFVPDEEDRRWVEPALLTLLGLEPAPAGGRDVLFAAWRIFFERVAARGTTVLLFEDLQWADSGLLDFIEYLLEWSRGVPLVVVTLARPEMFDRRPEWGSRSRNLARIALAPLSDAAMRELLDGFVPGLPGEATAAILERSGGVPLYAVETVRALLAEGRLERVGSGYRPVGELSAAAIPDSLRSLILSRLDGLDGVDRSIVQDASVLGQTFTMAGLAATSGRDQGQLESHLRTLVRREILEVEADARSPERGQYRFVQALIREVAYATLARADRRSRHLAAARYYESLGDDELAGALASHYLAARGASSEGAEAEAVAIQARLALRGAAERAATLGAHDQAVGYLRQALEITADPGERGDLLLRAATSASLGADNRLAADLAREARDLYRAAGELVGAARASHRLGSALLYAAEPAEAIPVLEDAMATLAEDAPPEVRATLQAELSRAHMRANQPARAIEVADQALPVAERLGLLEVIADTFNNKGSSLGYLGRSREGAALLTAAVELARTGGFVASELRARSNLAATMWPLQPRAAVELQRETLELARRVGNRSMVNWLLFFVANDAYSAGRDWDAMLAELQEALETVRDSADEVILLGAISYCRTARGEIDDALLARLDTLCASISDPYIALHRITARGDATFVRGDYRAAYDLLMQAEPAGTILTWPYRFANQAALWLGDEARAQRAADLLDRVVQAETVMGRLERRAAFAAVEALRGRRQEAADGYAEAIGGYRAIGYDFDLALTILNSLRALGRSLPDAASLGHEARAVFERVGARPYLDRLDAELARAAAAATTEATPADRVRRDTAGEPAPFVS